MKTTKIGDNEMYSIDIAPLTKRKLNYVTNFIKDISCVAMGLMATWILVTLYLTITGK